MMIGDVMAPFELYQPAGLREAFGLLDRFGTDAWKLAGGNDSLDWFKARIKRPKAVIDLTSIPGLRGIRALRDGVEIGATTTLAALARDPLIRARFRLLADAAARVASPQIRNTATIGGNLAQHARCLYYRSGLDCFRAGGGRCFADTPESVTREHALFDIGRCLAVNPSDVAPALAALDARMVLMSSAGQRMADASEFFTGARTDPTTLNCIRPGEILVAIRLPEAWAGAHCYFEKVADRRAWDFALVNVAAVMKVGNGRIEEARIVCGAVSSTPWRLPAVEEAITGRARDEATSRLAGEIATRGALRLTWNGFKVPLMAGLVTRAVRDARAAGT
jgi:xanthine dehydrogenase YagS FAD-binding subunit